MKAAVTTGQPGFEVIDLPDPTPDADQLVIQVEGCGVCGSDIKAQPFAPAGMVMGHEFGGRIVAAGRKTGWWPDSAIVAVLPVISCGSCQACVAGFVSHCAQVSYIGMGPAGGFAEYAAVPARHCFALPPDLPASYSPLVEPFAVGLHGVHSAEIGPGDDVLIVGAGGVGLTTLAWALLKGGARVTVADPDARRRESAMSMGATDVLHSVVDAEPATYDAVLECVGIADLVQASQPALRARGRLVISGAAAEPTAIEPVTALLNELTIRYSVAYAPDEFREVIAALEAGDLDPTPVIGPTFDLDHLADAFAAVREAKTHGRVAVRP